jgi:hypothetical protein
MMEDPDQAPVPPTTATGETEAFETSELTPEDFYFDGPYMVFTAAYHLKRGYCCNSECRHCPYR